MEKAVAKAPDCETATKLARANYLLADGHIFFEGDEVKDKYRKTHEKGMSAGEQALAICSPGFKAKMQAGSKMEEALDTLDAKSPRRSTGTPRISENGRMPRASPSSSSTRPRSRRRSSTS